MDVYRTPDDRFGTMARWELGLRHRRRQLLPGTSFSQRPGVLPDIHVPLHGQEHIDPPLLLAARDVFPIDKPAVQDKPFDHPWANMLDKLLHQLIEHRAFMDIARHYGQRGVNVAIPAQMQQANQFVTTLAMHLLTLLNAKLFILHKMIVLIKPHNH